MLTIEGLLEFIQTNPTLLVVAALMCYAGGFASYITSMYMQVRNKQCPFYFWQHCWYFGHDIVFSLLFYQWFNIVKFWLFKVMCIACMVFVLIEIFSLYRAVKYERQEIWGKYHKGQEVTVKQALIRGISGYAIGALLFLTLRAVLNDPTCLFLMMSTNVTQAMMVHRRADEIGKRQPGQMALAWFTVYTTAFTFAPAGIGFFPSVIPALSHPLYFIVGGFCWIVSIRAVYLAFKQKKDEELYAKSFKEAWAE